MKSLTGVCGVIAALTFVCLASGQDKKEVEKEVKQLQGNWRVISSQVADDKASDDEVKKRKVTVKGNVLTYDYGNDRNEKQEGTIKLDPKTKAFDWVWT